MDIFNIDMTHSTKKTACLQTNNRQTPIMLGNFDRNLVMVI
jgi:hypothetical protein